MRSKLAAGMTAGFAAAMVSGSILQGAVVASPQGDPVSAMSLLSRAAGSDDPAVGWGANLVLGLLLGAWFGIRLGRRAGYVADGIALGCPVGLACWVAGGLILMPLLLGMPVLAPLTAPHMRPLAFATLAAAGVFGAGLGGLFPLLHRGSRRAIRRARARAA